MNPDSTANPASNGTPKRDPAEQAADVACTAHVPVPALMIDRPDCGDRDDAIRVRRTEGGWRAEVWIALVAAAVPAGGEVDQAARVRLRTRYLADRTIPMLGSATEQVAALRPGARCPAMRITLDIGADGSIGRAGVTLDATELDQPVAASFPEAAAAIDDTAHPLHEAMSPAYDVARVLLSRRRAGGALAVYDIAAGWATDEEGNVVRLGEAERNAGYLVVQELMIATNAAVAIWCVQQELPILFRNHRLSAVAPPRERLLEDLTAAEAASAESTRGKGAASEKSGTEPVEALRERLALLQRPTAYEPYVGGHFALNLPAYTHVTSPLRRYADLVNQRILLAAVQGTSTTYDVEELATLGREIDRHLARWKEQRAEEYRAAASARARHRLAAEAYSELSESELNRVLEVAVRQARPPAALAEELRRRLEAGELTVRHLCRVLFFAGHGWRRLQRAILDRVADEPAQAITLVTMYADLTRRDPVTWETEDIETPGAPTIFEASAASGSTVSAKRRASSKREARQQASLGLIAALTGLPDLSSDLARPVIPTAPEEPDLPAIVEGLPPLVAVNQLRQAGVLTEPEWSFEADGPAHEPSHRCAVQVTDRRTGGALSAVATGSSKTAAKTAVARILLTDLLEPEVNGADAPNGPRDRIDESDASSRGDSGGPTNIERL